MNPSFPGSQGLYQRQGILNRKLRKHGNRRNMTTAVWDLIVHLLIILKVIAAREGYPKVQGLPIQIVVDTWS